MALSSNFAQEAEADADIVRIIGEHLRRRKSRWWKERTHMPGSERIRMRFFRDRVEGLTRWEKRIPLTDRYHCGNISNVIEGAPAGLGFCYLRK